MTRLATIMLLTSVSTVAAQQSPLAGVWQVSYVAGMRIENGLATPLEATGVLTIGVQGDSLIGNLVTAPAPDRPIRPPLRMAAKAEGPTPVFVSEGQAMVRRNGVQLEVTVVSTWKLAVTGDSLVGTVERRLEGIDAPDQGAQPVRGKRREG